MACCIDRNINGAGACIVTLAVYVLCFRVSCKACIMRIVCQLICLGIVDAFLVCLCARL
jgi:hypothetical protein